MHLRMIPQQMMLGLLFLALAAGPALASDTVDLSARLQPETFELKNGLQVVVIPDHRVPVVTHMVWYRVGSADEEMGKSGLAHFFEHLMFKGTKKFGKEQFSKIVARNGGVLNAFTSMDYTAYYERIALNRLPLVMEMEADRMRNLIITDDVFYPERDVVIEERNMRVENSPIALLYEQINAALFQNSGYGIPVIGWRHELEQLTREQAVDFYNTHYAPNNAILVVAGDITAQELKPLAKKYYGAVKAGKPRPRTRTTEPPQVAARRVVITDGRVEQPSWTRSYFAPSSGTSNGKDIFALQVLEYILGGNNNSRLFKRLVIEERKAASASAGYSPTAVNGTSFDVFIVPSKGVSLPEIEALFEQEIEAFLQEGVSEEEVATAVKTLLSDAIFALDSQVVLANNFGRTLASGGAIEDVVSWPQRMAEVTAADVNAAAKVVLRKEKAVTGWLLKDETGKEAAK